MSAIPALGFVGRSGCGKTTLLEQVLRELLRRGYRVALVKHTHHRDLETDLPGTDSRRFWDAGAAQVALLAPDRLVVTRRHIEEPPLEAVLAQLGDVDLVLVEGYKRGSLPKIEVVRAAHDATLLPGLENRIACVTDVSDLPWDGPRLPFDAAAVADFIEREVRDGTLARG